MDLSHYTSTASDAHSAGARSAAALPRHPRPRGTPVEAQNKRRCRRTHAARLHSHRRPGRYGTSTCETRCGTRCASGASRAASAVCGVNEPAAFQSLVSSVLAARGGSPNGVSLRWYTTRARQRCRTQLAHRVGCLLASAVSDNVTWTRSGRPRCSAPPCARPGGSVSEAIKRAARSPPAGLRTRGAQNR